MQKTIRIGRPPSAGRPIACGWLERASDIALYLLLATLLFLR